MRSGQGPHSVGMFGGAHRVHDRKAQPKAGSSSFKVRHPHPHPPVHPLRNGLCKYAACQLEGAHSAPAPWA